MTGQSYCSLSYFFFCMRVCQYAAHCASYCVAVTRAVISALYCTGH